MRGGLVAAGLTVALALGACSPDKGFKTERISRSDYGDSWPLNVERALLACEPGNVPTVTVDGHSFGLDDWRETKDLRRRPDLNEIRARDDRGRFMDLDVLLEDALALCD